MRMRDVATQLKKMIPRRTALFHDVLSLVSLTATSSLATATTATPHGLNTGREVSIANVETRTPIASTSAVSATVRSFITSADHDLTMNNPQTENVRFIGFTNSLWNAEHALIGVRNRREFLVSSTGLPAPVLNGNEKLLEPYRIDGVNGLHIITTTSPTTFTYPGNFLAGVYTPINGLVATSPRISVTTDIDRGLEILQESHAGKRHWMYVISEGAAVSKDRYTEGDAIHSAQAGNDIRQRVLHDFTVAVVAPTPKSLDAAQQIDVCGHDLMGPILAALFGVTFPSGVACDGKIKTVLRGHSLLDYRSAWMVYGYQFQAIYDISERDALFADGDRAFRDIDYTQHAFIDLTAAIDLDEEPAA